jgi:hypothetical protein
LLSLSKDTDIIIVTTTMWLVPFSVLWFPTITTTTTIIAHITFIMVTTITIIVLTTITTTKSLLDKPQD